MKKFRDLNSGDYVWVVFNLNWNKSNHSKFDIFSPEYELTKALIINNEIDKLEEYDRGDRWESDIVTISTNYITILFNDIEYKRNYEDFYDKRGQMTITKPLSKIGPDIEIFTEKENAENYIKELCNRGIKYIDEKIESLNFAKSLLEKSLTKIK